MRTRAKQLAQGLVLSTVLFAPAFLLEPPGSGETAEGGPFSRSVLLRRFDVDGDGQLDSDEKATLRDAFGGIDVPMLPAKPYDYTSAERSNPTRSDHLRRMDSTPDDNPTTDHGVALGRVLFYDKQLSRNDTISCSSCHHQQHGFADPRPRSVGFEGGRTTRNAMGLANLRYTNLRGLRPGFFWDERAPTLEVQALMPIQDRLEMGMELSELEDRLRQLPYYQPLFSAAFGSPEITSRRIARALAQFMRSLVSFNSKFDRSAAASRSSDTSDDFDGFTARENSGKSLFIEGVGGIAEFGCAFCHIPPTFTMPKAFNNGLDAKYKDRGLGALGRPSNDPFTPTNDGKFKAPSLRNVELTAPYMHDGRFKTLEQVIDHYSSGIHPHENLGLAFEDEEAVKTTSGFKFTVEQKAALVAFLKTLTDKEFVSERRFSDPFVRTGPKSSVKEPVKVADEGTAGPGSPADQYRALVDEYEQVEEPRKFAGRFLELAKAHPRDPVAVKALVWVLTKRRTRPEAGRALELLAKNHVQSEDIGSACPHVERTPSPAAEKLLRAVLEKNPHRKVRAQACWHLAALLEEQARVIDELKKKPELAARARRYYGEAYGEHLLTLDPLRIATQRERVYERLLESFADVPAKESTMGEIAASELFKVRHLSVGRVAPKIEGEDISGEKFRLTDYRGKVVVLSFWGHW